MKSIRVNFTVVIMTRKLRFLWQLQNVWLDKISNAAVRSDLGKFDHRSIILKPEFTPFRTKAKSTLKSGKTWPEAVPSSCRNVVNAVIGTFLRVRSQDLKESTFKLYSPRCVDIVTVDKDVGVPPTRGHRQQSRSKLSSRTLTRPWGLVTYSTA